MGREEMMKCLCAELCKYYYIEDIINYIVECLIPPLSLVSDK